jgi:hypothetical protein
MYPIEIIKTAKPSTRKLINSIRITGSILFSSAFSTTSSFLEFPRASEGRTSSTEILEELINMILIALHLKLIKVKTELENSQGGVEILLPEPLELFLR